MPALLSRQPRMTESSVKMEGVAGRGIVGVNIETGPCGRAVKQHEGAIRRSSTLVPRPLVVGSCQASGESQATQ